MLYASPRQTGAEGGGAGAVPYNVVIAASVNNRSIRALVNALGYDGSGPCTVNVTIDPGVIVGSTSTATAALITGAFPVGSILRLVNNGRVQGKGGKGGDGSAGAGQGGNGLPGGPAIEATVPLAIDNTNGEIWGGGGGGGASAGNADYVGDWDRGGSGGGGGAGTQPGAGGIGGAGQGSGGPGSNAPDGTATAGGAPGSESNVNSGGSSTAGDTAAGGGPGEPGRGGRTWTAGQQGSPGVGGAAGNAVTGNSQITWIAFGDRRGTIAA